MILMIFLGIIILLNNLRSDLKQQWFRLWCQTRSSLSSHPKRYSVEHILDRYSLLRQAPTILLSTYFNLVGIWYGLSVVVRSSSPDSSISSCPKILIYMCFPREPPWCAPLGWKTWQDLTLSSISQCLLGQGDPYKPPSRKQKVLIGHHNFFPRSFPWQFFFLEVRVTEGDPHKEGRSGIHGGRPPYC